MDSRPSTPASSEPESSISAAPESARLGSITKRRPDRSTIWKHFRNAKDSEEKTDKKGNRMHYCIYCSSRNAWGTSNSQNAKWHIANQHQNVTIDPTPLKSTRATQRSLDTLFARQVGASSTITTPISTQLTREVFLEAVIQLIINHDCPFRLVEWPAFRALLALLDERALEWLPESHTSIPPYIDASYRFYYNCLAARVQASQSLIHLSVDLWTSEHRHAYLAVVAHWVDDWQKQEALLQLPRVFGKHDGENLAKYVYQVLKEFEIQTKLGYITSDNASSNNTLMSCLSRTLQREDGHLWDHTWHRVRCICHIMNISLHAFMFGESKEAFEAAEAQAMAENDDIALVVERRCVERAKQRARKRKVTGEELEFVGWREIGASVLS
jgi:hypothetical protein